MPCTQNWIWIPARYVWTPRGYIYRCGYWDFDFVRRGAIFAPVCFNRPIYFRPGYCYSPSFVLRIDLGFLAHVFVRRNCNQYYFGNWYGQSGLGYQPWAVPQSHYRHYDPLLTYYSGQRNRNNLNVAIWIRNQQSQFKNHDELRPPLTYSYHDRHKADNQHGHTDRAANGTALVESYAARVKRSQTSSVKMPVNADSNRQPKGQSNGQTNGKSYRQLTEQERKQEAFGRQVNRGGNQDRKTNSTIAQQQSKGSGNISKKNGRPVNRQNDEQKRQIQTDLANGRKRESMPSGNTTQQPGGRRLQTQLEKNAADAFKQTQTRERQPNQSAKGPVDVKPKQEQLGRNQDRQRQQLAQQKLQQQQGQQRAQQLRESKDRPGQQPIQQQIEAKPKQEQLGRNQDRQRQQQQLAQQTQQQGQQRAQQLQESKERLRQQPVQQQIEAKPKQEQLGRNQDRQRQQQQQQLTQQKLQQQQSQQRAQQLRESKDRPGQLPIQQQIEAKPNQEQLGRNQDRQRQQRLAQQQLQNQNQQLRIQQQQSQQQQGQPRAEQSRKLQDRMRQQQVQQQIEVKSKQDQRERNQVQSRQRQIAQQKLQDQMQQRQKQQQQQQQLNQKRAEQMRKTQEAARQQSQTIQRQQQQKQRAEQQRATLDRQRQQQQTQSRQAKLGQQPPIGKAPDRNGPQPTNRNNSSSVKKSGGSLKKSK